MPYHFFPMIARMRYINRWGLMRNTDLENIQEHSHMVAVLAHALAVLQNERFGGQVDPGAVAVAALYHDASEILTGDMPTPIKYDNPDIQSAYKQVEAVAEPAPPWPPSCWTIWLFRAAIFSSTRWRMFPRKVSFR